MKNCNPSPSTVLKLLSQKSCDLTCHLNHISQPFQSYPYSRLSKSTGAAEARLPFHHTLDLQKPQSFFKPCYQLALDSPCCCFPSSVCNTKPFVLHQSQLFFLRHISMSRVLLSTIRNIWLLPNKLKSHNPYIESSIFNPHPNSH